jgi:hypothetical protein
MLRRFLKARDWDVVKAKAMWQDMLAFRCDGQAGWLEVHQYCAAHDQFARH